MSLIVAFLSATLVVVNTKEEHLKYTLHEFKDHTGKVQVSLSNAGEGTFSGPLISHSGTCGVQQIRVDGTTITFLTTTTTTIIINTMIGNISNIGKSKRQMYILSMDGKAQGMCK